MQKYTISAASLNAAMQEVKKLYGDEVIIEHTVEMKDSVSVTVSVFEEVDEIVIPNLSDHPFKRDDGKIDNPLLAIRTVETLARKHYLGNPFKDIWMHRLAPFLTLAGINLAESLDACLNFNSMWLKFLNPLKPVVFLGSHGVGKTQFLAKVASYLIAHDKAVVIYNLDTIKMSGQGMLEAYAQKLNVLYFFAKDAWQHLQQNKNNDKIIKLIDTSGINFNHYRAELEWLEPFVADNLVESILLIGADQNPHQDEPILAFIKNLRIKNLGLTKLDMQPCLGLPLKVANASQCALVLMNESPQLNVSLKPLHAEIIYHYLSA